MALQISFVHLPPHSPYRHCSYGASLSPKEIKASLIKPTANKVQRGHLLRKRGRKARCLAEPKEIKSDAKKLYSEINYEYS